MDTRQIERLRAPQFSIARRGYDQREVDNLLAALADWLESDAAAEIGQFAIKHKLELVGKSTAHILLKAEEEAERLQRRTEEECAELRSGADVAAREARRAADEYAQKTRERVDDEARRTVEAAKAKARRTVEDAEGGRAQIEGAITELTSRRDELLEQLDGLQTQLASTVAKHRETRKGGKDERRAIARKEGVAQATPGVASGPPSS